jgi:hypothetical protein
MPMRIQSAGRYEFEVRGYDDPDGDRCKQGWTKRIGFTVGHRGGNPNPDDAPVEGLIADRWHLYDAWDGPLGRPLGQAITLPLVLLVPHGCEQVAALASGEYRLDLDPDLDLVPGCQPDAFSTPGAPFASRER